MILFYPILNIMFLSFFLARFSEMDARTTLLKQIENVDKQQTYGYSQFMHLE